MMSHGLTPLETRKLGYSLEKSNRVKPPSSWDESEAVSRYWFNAFLKRNKTLFIRTLKPTSQGCVKVLVSVELKKLVVEKFFDNLMEVMLKYQFAVFRIWNTDKTGIPTVLLRPKVVASKGPKQVQQMASHERVENTFIFARRNSYHR